MLRYCIAFISFQLICLIFSLQSIVKQGLTHSIPAKPGDHLPIKIQLVNPSDQPQLYTLSLHDYCYQASGEVNYLKAGQIPRSNAPWIHLSTRYITLPPKGEGNVFYDIHVPEDQTLAGSYWSIILIEPTEPLPVKEPQTEGFNLEVKIRYAYQIVTTVEGGSPKLEIEDHRLADMEGKSYLILPVKNTGALYLVPSGYLKLYDHQGRMVYATEIPPQKILPGCSVSAYFPLGDLPPATYSALLFFDDKQKNVFCFRVNVAI